MWIDNFSKFLSRSVPTIKGDIFSSCLWTGVCMFQTKLPVDIDKIKLDCDGDIVPAMPPDLFACQDDIINCIRSSSQITRDYYVSSYVRRFEVNQIPPKLDVKKYPELLETFDFSSYNVRDLKPKELIQENIGSNRGLLSIMRTIYDSYGMDSSDCERYITVNVDENIYYRILKVRSNA